jgi:hypothetical protein
VRAEQAEVLAGQVDRELARQGRVVAERPQRADATHLQAESDRPVAEDADRIDQEVHPHRVGDVLGPGQPGLDQRKPGLHEHHQEPAQQGPDDVQRGLRVQRERTRLGDLFCELCDR